MSNSFNSLKGTLIIAAIAKDGIVIVADSRASIAKDAYDSPVAYFDNNNKIFVIGNYLMASKGQVNINFHVTIAKTVNEFNSKYVKNNDIIKTSEDYANYLIKKYPPQELQPTSFIFAGYHQGQPAILIRDMSNPEKYQAAAEEAINISDVDAVKYFGEYSNKLSSKIIIEKAEFTMKTFPKEHNKQASIGGELSKAMIIPTGEVKWLQNNFYDTHYYNSYIDIAKDILDEKIKLQFTDYSKKEEVLNFLKEIAKIPQ